MFEALSTTEILATLIGIYMVAAGIGLFTERYSYAAMLDQLRDNVMLGYLAAVIAFSIGAAIVAIHNVWTDPLAIAVSVIGWAALAEGVLMLAARRRFLAAVAMIPLNSRTLIPFGAFTIIFGAVLLFGALG